MILWARMTSSRARGVGDALANDEPIARRHPVGDRAGAVHEAEIARRQQAEQTPARVDDDERADAGAAHGLASLGERRVGPNRVRVGDDAVLPPLDALDLANLRLDVAGAEPAVDDADAAFFGDGDRHLGARDRVHVGGHDRPLQRQVLGEPSTRDRSSPDRAAR